MLNSHQLDLVKKIIATLEPVEEITKMISTYVAATSTLIPLLGALEKSLTKHHDDSGVQTMKSKMLSSLKRRFADVEENEVLIIATVVDPRYKDKIFAKLATKELAKQSIVDMCNKIIEATDTEPLSKKQHIDDNSGSATSKVWECMAEIFKDSGECSSDAGGC